MKKVFKVLFIIGFMAGMWFSVIACSEPDAAMPVLTGTVSITGTARVGETLTANTSSLDGNGTITYQWKRGTVDIGTNSDTYLLLSADFRSTITVTVTRSGYSGSVSSAPTAVIGSPAIKGLKSLIPAYGTLSPLFDTAITNYALVLPNDVEQITFRAEAEDDNVTLAFDPAEAEDGETGVSLTEGVSVTISIIITAPNNTAKTYRVNVTRSLIVPTEWLNILLGTIKINDVEIADGTDCVIRIYDSANTNNQIGVSFISYKVNQLYLSKLTTSFTGTKTFYFRLEIGNNTYFIEKTINLFEPAVQVDLGDLNLDLHTITVSANITYSGITQDMVKEAELIINNVPYHNGGLTGTSIGIDVNGGQITGRYTGIKAPFNFEVYVSIRLDNNQRIYSPRITLSASTGTFVTNVNQSFNFDLIKVSGTLGNVTVNGITPTPNSIGSGHISGLDGSSFFPASNAAWVTYIERRNSDVQASFYFDIYNFIDSVRHYTVIRNKIEGTWDIGTSDKSDINLGNVEIPANQTAGGTLKDGTSLLSSFIIAAIPNQITSRDEIYENIVFYVNKSETNGNWSFTAPDSVPANVWFLIVTGGKYYITPTAVPLNGTTLDIRNMVELF